MERTLSPLSVLFLIFLVLKMTDNVNWGWIWVFSPYWIFFGLIVIFEILGRICSHPE